MEYSLPQTNNAITAYMGGPIFLKQVILGMEEEILVTGPEDLEFHTNWNWIMPVWKKLRRELSEGKPSALVLALSDALDTADLELFHKLIGDYCVKWCQRKQIKF